MSEYIQLYQLFVHYVVIKVCSYGFCCFIISRFLYRGKFIYRLVTRKYYHSSRMLSCCLSCSFTPLCYSFYFSFSFMNTAFLKVLFYITKCISFCQCRYCPCTKYMIFSKKLFCVSVNL